MFLPPLASPKGFQPALAPQTVGEEGIWYLFDQAKILTSTDGRELPTFKTFLKRSFSLGTLGGLPLFVGELEGLDQIPSGWVWNSLRDLFGVISDEAFAIAGRAMQLLEWDRTHQFCGSCASATFIREREWCRECPSCGRLCFPTLSPAIMALVTKENKMLLARGERFPKPFYSVLAGFVEPGETLEQCVAREVYEEVGMQVKNIHYFGSQPWPFSQSLMIGFTCEWESGEIRIDPTEIVEARWFDATDLPQLPSPLSLSRLMIEAHLNTAE